MYRDGNHQYAKFEFNKALTDNEKAFIADLTARKGKVPVVLESDNYPIGFYNAQEGKFQGISVEVLDEIALLTGIEFENIAEPGDAWSKVLDKLTSGKAAMVSELGYTDERKGRFLWSETPYTVGRYALLSKMDYPYLEPYQVVRVTVGITSETDRVDVYRALFPNNDNIKYYDSQGAVIAALESGEIDLMMMSENEFLTMTNYLEKPGYKINITFNSPLMDSFFGFNKNEETLCSIISKALRNIDATRIERGWLHRTFDYEKKMAEERSFHANQRSLFLALSAIILFFLLIVLAVLFVKNNKMRRLYKVAHKRAEYAHRAKSEFMARMSHEMRTPMNAIMGLTHLVQIIKEPDKVKQYFNEIDIASKQLLGLIDDVLDISGMEHDTFKLNDAVFSFKQMFHTVQQSIVSHVTEKQQTFNYTIDSSIPESLIGDEKRLRQVMGNLLSNAIKFTPKKGEINFKAGVLGEDKESVTLQMEIADNGMGISREQQESLFQIFEQIDGGNTRKHSGIGLGLHLSRRIIEMMDGKIGVESELGKGSRFTFTVKLKKETVS
jgi:signal transduction histidine kinase